MRQYHNLSKRILREGDIQFDPRTEVYRLGISGENSIYDLREGFPLVTTKNVPVRLPAEELFWKLRGERNVKSLVDRDVHIWTANAFDHWVKRNGWRDRFPKHSSQWNEEFERYKEQIASDPKFAKIAGDLGPVYGYQWRHGFTRDRKQIDQLKNMLEAIRGNPGNAYHVLNAWNPAKLKDMALGPCPFWHQFTIYGDQLDLTIVQRSCDELLGVPFNVAQDAVLTHMIANEFGLKPRYLNHMTINTHFYLGVPPRANFWLDSENLESFQKRFKQIKKRADYLDLRDWYLRKAPGESPGNERKDHVPFILEQLSKAPRTLPTIEVARMPFFDLIKQPAKEVITLRDYSPHKWDSKAVMAA
jgi:thymidylate synthase